MLCCVVARCLFDCVCCVDLLRFVLLFVCLFDCLFVCVLFGLCVALMCVVLLC